MLYTWLGVKNFGHKEPDVPPPQPESVSDIRMMVKNTSRRTVKI
jgi:hypothetical protein